MRHHILNIKLDKSQLLVCLFSLSILLFAAYTIHTTQYIRSVSRAYNAFQTETRQINAIFGDLPTAAPVGLLSEAARHKAAMERFKADISLFPPNRNIGGNIPLLIAQNGLLYSQLLDCYTSEINDQLTIREMDNDLDEYSPDFAASSDYIMRLKQRKAEAMRNTATTKQKEAEIIHQLQENWYQLRIIMNISDAQ